MSQEKTKLFKESICTRLTKEMASKLSDQASMALKLPEDKDKQMDLQYMNAIFVSSGMNKNGAVFLGSELIKARNTIEVKAIDVEHDERSIIGHISKAAFLTRTGDHFDAEAAANTMSPEEMDGLELDVGISGVIYKARFPEIAQEIADGNWMVSMECFYRDYDIKVGDMIIPRDMAENLGYDRYVGHVVQVRYGGVERGFHLVGRVLRDIIFSGVGIVKDPANERSIIMETAAYNEQLNSSISKPVSTIDLDKIANISVNNYHDKLTNSIRNIIKEELANLRIDSSSEKETSKSEGESMAGEKLPQEEAQLTGLNKVDQRPGTCVSYKRYVYDIPTADNDTMPPPPTDLSQYPQANHPGAVDELEPGAKVVREHYCSLFDTDCSSRPGDATHPDCWRNLFARTVAEEVDSYHELLFRNRISKGLVELQNLIESAKRFKK